MQKGDKLYSVMRKDDYGPLSIRTVIVSNVVGQTIFDFYDPVDDNSFGVVNGENWTDKELYDTLETTLFMFKECKDAIAFIAIHEPTNTDPTIEDMCLTDELKSRSWH